MSRATMGTISSFIAGLLFGLGLVVSLMVDPAKIQGFLDIAGRWDPSLLLVMAGALAVGFAGFTVAGRRETSLLGEPMRFPEKSRIDTRLAVGNAMFGAGWGLAGFCPGPALTAIGMGEWKAMLFAAAMLAGMGIYEFLERRHVAPPATLAE